MRATGSRGASRAAFCWSLRKTPQLGTTASRILYAATASKVQPSPTVGSGNKAVGYDEYLEGKEHGIHPIDSGL